MRASHLLVCSTEHARHCAGGTASGIRKVQGRVLVTEIARVCVMRDAMFSAVTYQRSHRSGALNVRLLALVKSRRGHVLS